MKVINFAVAWMRLYPIAAISMLMAIAMSIFIPNFATATNLSGVGAQLSFVGISAVGLSFILIGGGLDLSLGTAMSASAVISGLTMVNVIGSMSRISTPTGIIIIISTCVAFAAINGYFIAYWKINAFIMTLITQLFFKGLALFLTNSFSVTGLPVGFTALGKTTLLNVPVSIFVMLAFIIIGQLILSKTSYGRQLFATGANEKAAKLIGIPTNVVLFKAFLLGGLCNSVSAIILVGKQGVVNPIMANYLLLDIISATVLGGNSLFGGKGSVVGTAFGVLLLGLISNGLNMLGVQFQITKYIKGVIIILAISLNQINERISTRRMLKFSSAEDLKAHAKDI